MSTPPVSPPRPAGPSAPPRPAGPPRTKPTDAEVLYPVAEVAALWRCTPKHIYNLIAKGQLRTTQIGIGRAKTRIPASAVAEFVAGRTPKGKAA